MIKKVWYGLQSLTQQSLLLFYPSTINLITVKSFRTSNEKISIENPEPFLIF